MITADERLLGTPLPSDGATSEDWHGMSLATVGYRRPRAGAAEHRPKEGRLMQRATIRRLARAAFATASILTAAAMGVASGTQAAGKPITVKAANLSRQPGNFLGQQVTVSAFVEQTLGRYAFTLDQKNAATVPDVLVLVPEAVRAPKEGQEVTVTGSVRIFTEKKFARAYPWFANDVARPDIIARVQNRPVIIATSVRTQNGEELAQPKRKAKPGGRGQGGPIPMASPVPSSTH